MEWMAEMAGHSSYRREAKKVWLCFFLFPTFVTPTHFKDAAHYSGLGFLVVSGNSGTYNCQCSVWPSSALWNMAQHKTMGCVMQ